MKFEELGLSQPLLRAVADEGYSECTPIQSQTIPHLLAGRDLLGCAQTGTGKTAAFALPILHLLHERRETSGPRRAIRSLILSPTRELAAQIADSFAVYGRYSGLRSTVIYGGVNQFHQVKSLRAGVDILVATPGRLLDLMNQGHVNLSSVEMFVLDEADRMFDMGFLPDLRRVMSRLPAQRQNLLFSATMPPPIEQLAQSTLRDPVRIVVAPQQATIDLIEQSVHFVPQNGKQYLLERLLGELPAVRAIVFTRTKHGADRVVKQLDRAGITAAAIHGNKSQAARQRALEAFKASRLPVLVATDLAARGLDVDGVSHVFNFDLPNEPETYLHRVGRTGRAGASGIAIAFCSEDERSDLRSIERLTRQRIRVASGTPLSTFERPRDREPVHAQVPRQRPAQSVRPPLSRPASSARPAPVARIDRRDIVRSGGVVKVERPPADREPADGAKKKSPRGRRRSHTPR